MVDVSSSTNQQFLDNLQKCKAIAKMSKEWLHFILKETEKQIIILDNASKETVAIIKKVESNNEGFEKERNNWVKVVLGLKKFMDLVCKFFRLNALTVALMIKPYM